MLSNCRDTIIGGGISFDGISQGERKLLALATALLTKPAILFVEEPTAGLDTRSAESIVAKLRDLAHEQNMIVIGTLHRFSSHLYSLVDYLYLVADASCVYDGKAANAVAYFSSIGYPCPAYTSPMDYFMLQMAIDDGESDEESVARVALLKREWFERNALVYADNVAQARVACNDALLSDYEHKNRYRHMGCGNQIWLLWTRHVRRLSRYGYIFGRHLMATLLFGIIFGLVYLHVDINDENGIQNVVGLFFYIVVIQMLFMAFRAFIYLPRETALALRERQDYRGGWYYLLCWYVTKMAAELPALVAYSIALFAPVFVLVKIDEGFLIYVSMQIVVILAGWVAVALAFFVLSALRDATRALMVYVVIVTTFIVMGGFFLKVTNIPDYLLWLHYLSPVTFAYEAMMKIFWQQVKTIACGNTCVAHTGEQVLELYRLNSSRSALSNSLLLFAIGIVLYLATLCNLLLLATKKRHSTLQWRYDWKYTTLVHRKKRAFQNNVDTCHIKDGKCDVHNINQGVTGNFDKHYIQIETPRIESRSDVPRMTLGWQCTLIIKHALWKKQDTVVLDDASGLATCGELCLITGPSNTSNVALLKSLHGHSPAREFKGVITLNGVKSSFQQLSHYTAFVSSLNVFYETLTVIEHLHFQAFLTLSNPIHAIITERINRILEELELSCKRNTRISDLSHVYTKQLAIATALLQNPSIVLLETPTKHMNLVSSQRLILLLRQLARTGRTIIVTMNTPLSHQVALFDTLNLLIDGVTVFHGNVTEVVPFIASLGYECPFNWNPIDFFISILSKQDMTSEARRELRNRFKACGNYHLPLPHLNGFHDENEMWRTKELDVKRSKGFFLVVLMVLHRQFLVLIRCRCFYYWQAFWMLCLGLVVGLFFRQLDLDDQEDILNWTGAFYVLIVLQMMVNGTRTFVLIPYEWALMEYEPRYTQFVLFIWCCIKESTELVLLLVFSIILFVPAYLLMGIRHGFQLYFYMQLVLWMAGWSATGMATLVLGLVRHVRSAGFVFMIMLLFMATFGGLLIHVDDIPDYFSWVHYISPVKYGYEALMKLFWGRIGLLACNRGNASGSGSMAAVMVGDTFSHSMSSASYEKDSDCIARSGIDVLAYYSMDSSRNARSDCLILLSLSVVSIFIGYVALSLRWRWYKSTA
ncbi:hypothetical protein CCR75_009032 [Bremia lactucae]|uniref:ABC transporter domain-containing protein n=1 Tax=Bremia lactucae TaxID=4779 RepID=A0A976FI16_BRELC|nr:hypothetical protein CCR75_009032 [Bremia lactucae]